MARTACLVCFISTVNGRSKKEKKKKKKLSLGRTGTSRGHKTNLKQSILETFDIYELLSKGEEKFGLARKSAQSFV